MRWTSPGQTGATPTPPVAGSSAYGTEWLTAVGICVGIWSAISLLSTGWMYFWPGWVAGPWGVFLLVQTISGLSNSEPQRWAAKRARKQAERELRRQARRDDASIE